MSLPASFAVIDQASKGRLFPEKPHPYRSDFERDRDRIIHCSAFRRLEGKTQVFTPGLDDYYRTRLTHTIEVTQIGRTIARALGLNEALTEAICLAHDLGHSPFGHAGEEALNEIMAGFGGFEHNRQTLRIVELLEHPYPGFRGLNLMYETRLGLSRHRSPYDKPETDEFVEKNCSLEGQVANVADRIAYNCHDLEDGLRARILSAEQLRGISLFEEAQSRIQAETIQDLTIRRTRTAKILIDRLACDCIETSAKIIAECNVRNLSDVYSRERDLITFSPQCADQLAQLEQFLLEHFYHNSRFAETSRKVRDWLTELFQKLHVKPELMPGYFRDFVPGQGLERTICDYIAGMTDRFCRQLLKPKTPE